MEILGSCSLRSQGPIGISMTGPQCREERSQGGRQEEDSNRQAQHQRALGRGLIEMGADPGYGIGCQSQSEERTERDDAQAVSHD